MSQTYFSGKKCLVLGGLGFIGSHLIDALAEAGSEIVSFDRPRLNPPARPENLERRVSYFDGDFTSAADVGAAIEGCEVCFHLISTTLPKTSNADPVYDAETNLLGSLRLLDLIIRQRTVPKFVFISSGGTVYGVPKYVPIDEDHPTNPICAYGIAKLAIEKYLELYRILHGLEYSILRLSNPFGGRQRIDASQGAVAVFMGKIIRRESIEIWGDGATVRDYIDISDVMSALLKAAEVDSTSRIFNIGSGTGRSLNDVLDVIESVTGKQATRTYINPRIFDVPVNVLDIGRAKQELDWSPTLGFRDAVARMYESIR